MAVPGSMVVGDEAEAAMESEHQQMAKRRPARATWKRRWQGKGMMVSATLGNAIGRGGRGRSGIKIHSTSPFCKRAP